MKREIGETELDIIYEDQWIIVVDKPSGLLSISTGREGEITAYSIMRKYMEGAHPRSRDRRIHNDWQRLFIVHRLDKDTSGVLIFAKDAHTKEILQTHWNEIVLERQYIAIVEGRPSKDEGRIQTFLFQDPISYKIWSSSRDNGGKIAITDYHLLKSNNNYSMVEFQLQTGRKNQIRVHCQDLGCPIAGDKKYGAKTNPIGRLALHARCICLVHPYKNEEFEFISKLPNIFKRIKF